MKVMLKIAERLAKRCQHNGKLSQAHRWVALGLSLIPDRDLEQVCHFRNIRAFLWYLEGSKENFLREVERVLWTSNIFDFEAEIAQCHALLGIFFQDTQKNPQRALEEYQKSLEIRIKLGMRESCAKLHIHIATALKELGIFDKAKVHFFEAQALTRDRRVRINVILELARLQRFLQDFATCETNLQNALAAAQHRYPNEVGDCFRELYRLAADKGAHREAHQYAAQAMSIFEKHDYRAKVDALVAELKEKGYMHLYTENIGNTEETKS